VQRNDSALRFDAQTHVVSEIARLRVSIDREAVAVDKTLNSHPSTSEDDYPRWGWVEHKELSRQLGALHERVVRARSRSQDQLALRAELATLLSFAKTLRTDAETWRAAFEDGLKELERQETVARQERERLAAEREALMRRRDALQFAIDETAGRIAQENGGDCRRTLPVFRLGEALTVCSVTVLSPRKGFRSRKCWRVTLNDSRDWVRVRRG
jgi:chromosome segregation ATPase